MPLNNRWVSGSIIHHLVIWFQFQRTLREVLELYSGFRFSRPSLRTVEGRCCWPGGSGASRSLSMVADSSMYMTAMGEGGFKASQRPSLRLDQVRYTTSIDWHDLGIVLACWSRGELSFPGFLFCRQKTLLPQAVTIKPSVSGPPNSATQLDSSRQLQRNHFSPNTHKSAQLDN
jgi:hypothetical protein